MWQAGEGADGDGEIWWGAEGLCGGVGVLWIRILWVGNGKREERDDKPEAGVIRICEGRGGRRDGADAGEGRDQGRGWAVGDRRLESGGVVVLGGKAGSEIRQAREWRVCGRGGLRGLKISHVLVTKAVGPD